MTTDEKNGGKIDKPEWKMGWKVFVALVVLSVLEIVVTLTITNPGLWLVPLVLVKAALIIWYFMDLGQLRDKEATE